MYIHGDMCVYLRTKHIYTRLPHTSIHTYIVHVCVFSNTNIYIYVYTYPGMMPKAVIQFQKINIEIYIEESKS